LINDVGEKISLQFKQSRFISLENVFTYSVSNPDISEVLIPFGCLVLVRPEKLMTKNMVALQSIFPQRNRRETTLADKPEKNFVLDGIDG